MGTLCGFDDFVSKPLKFIYRSDSFFVDLVLDDAIEYDQQLDGSYVTSNVGSLLLNGNNVCIFVPGGNGPL